MRIREVLRGPRPAPRARRLVWQAAAVLLSYPQESVLARLPDLRAALAEPAGPSEEDRSALLAVADHLESLPLLQAQQDYVDTFDHRRRRTLFLTYWVAGDTRNRGAAILRFAQVYRAAGAAPPADELPDHLVVALEFAALVDPEAGAALLAEHATPLAMLTDALEQHASPYAGVVRAVCRTLPAPGPEDLRRARRLVMAGPPAEAVGLEPYPTPLPFPAVPGDGRAR